MSKPKALNCEKLRAFGCSLSRIGRAACRLVNPSKDAQFETLLAYSTVHEDDPDDDTHGTHVKLTCISVCVRAYNSKPPNECQEDTHHE